MRGYLCTCLMLCLPLTALAFPVEVELKSQGVSIAATSGYLSNIATVTLVNQGQHAALCEATFVNGPERPSASRVRIKAGEKTVLTQAFFRQINRVRVTVDCKAA